MNDKISSVCTEGMEYLCGGDPSVSIPLIEALYSNRGVSSAQVLHAFCSEAANGADDKAQLELLAQVWLF